MFTIEFQGETDWTEGHVFGPGIDGEWYKVTEINVEDGYTQITYEEVNRDA